MKCKNFTRAIKVCSKGPKKTTCGTEEKKVCKAKNLPGKCENVTEVKPNSCKKHCQGEGIFIFNIYLELCAIHLIYCKIIFLGKSTGVPR